MKNLPADFKNPQTMFVVNVHAQLPCKRRASETKTWLSYGVVLEKIGMHFVVPRPFLDEVADGAQN